VSKYQELSKAFAESGQRQTKYISDCCDFANFLFQKVAEYFEWPGDQMCFVLDESLYVGPQRCDTTVVRLKEDGYVYFFVLFTVKRLDNVNRSYQFIMPIKLKKFEETFLIQIINSSEELMLKTTDTEELEKFYEYIFIHMKNFFDTPFLNFTAEDFVRGTLSSDAEDD